MYPKFLDAKLPWKPASILDMGVNPGEALSDLISVIDSSVIICPSQKYFLATIASVQKICLDDCGPKSGSKSCLTILGSESSSLFHRI